MAKKLFITATNTNIGKTYASKKILHKLALNGLKIGAIKPIETGVDNIPQDARELLTIVKQHNKNFENFSPEDICAYTFSIPAAPFCATKKKIKLSKIQDKIKQLEPLCDILLIEGAGGLMVPIKKNYFMIDLIKELNCPTLLVTPSYLGCINETMLSINALEQHGINYNWCVNLYKDKESFSSVTKPFYDAYFDSWQTLDEYIAIFNPILV
jgi:dethiobiotin synthetase